MRLDKFISNNTRLSRKSAKKSIISGEISVNSSIITDPSAKIAETDQVHQNNLRVENQNLRYIMLNKPKSYICSTQNEDYPSALNFIDHSNNLHIAGRLDVDTTGLVLITDDGQWSHRISSPRKSCFKCYRVDLFSDISAPTKEIFKRGMLLKNDSKATLPATLKLLNSNQCLLSIQEGRYHQIKRMFAAVGNHVVGLHRLSIGNIALDPQLELGEWRYLNAHEIASVNRN